MGGGADAGPDGTCESAAALWGPVVHLAKGSDMCACHHLLIQDWRHTLFANGCYAGCSGVALITACLEH